MTSSLHRICILAVIMVVLTALAGCTPVPRRYKSHPELSQRKGDIRTIGLLPPVINMYEEQYKRMLVPHEEWSSAAVEAVTKALAAEMTANGLRLVMITTDDPELKEVAALYSAVDNSIQLEPLPKEVHTFDYSMGPLQGAMDRYKVDAVWIVRGFNLLPTAGVKLGEGLGLMLSILSMGSINSGPALWPQRFRLSLALVDKNGRVLYYGIADEHGAGWPIQEPLGEAAPAKGEIDLRDPQMAQQCIKAALSGYSGEAMP